VAKNDAYGVLGFVQDVIFEILNAVLSFLAFEFEGLSKNL
jgi:hypothetical protein